MQKSQQAIKEMNSYTTRRHNFIGQQMDANDGVLPCDTSDISGRNRSNSNNRSGLGLVNRSTTTLPEDQPRSISPTLERPAMPSTSPLNIELPTTHSAEKRKKWEQLPANLDLDSNIFDDIK